MRLDKYLKVSRLIKRRTVANEACDAGKVTVNGKPARASYDVKVGDILEITLGAQRQGTGHRGKGNRPQGGRGNHVHLRVIIRAAPPYICL